MMGRTKLIPVPDYWEASDDPLLQTLVANGGELVSALELIGCGVDWELANITGLILGNTRVTDDGMQALEGLTELKKFDSSELMTDATLLYLRDMVKMERLTLNKMHIKGDGLRHLAGMSRLVDLVLYGCKVTEATLSHLPAFPTLRGLWLNALRLSDTALLNLPTFPALVGFDLMNTDSYTGDGLECLARMDKLTSFRGNPAGRAGLRHLAGLRRLERLELNGHAPPMTTDDDDLAHLPPLPSVKHLDLSSTGITDAGLAHLGNLSGLRTVNLLWTNVGDESIRHLAALPALEAAFLNGTYVTERGVRELQDARPGILVTAQDSRGEPRRPPEPIPLIRRPEFRQAAPVAKSWDRIERWLAANFLKAFETLRPPASVEALDALEARVGRTLPADFRASYLIHDGQDDYGMGVLFGTPLMPIIEDHDGIHWQYEHRVEHKWEGLQAYEFDWTFYPPGAIREALSGPGWVPFYWAGGRDYLGIDLDPGPNGVVGQVIPFGVEAEFRPVLAPSFAHLLEDVADELEAGQATLIAPEMTNSPFTLKGKQFSDCYREWAEAKLPLAFQQVKAPPRFIPEDHATPILGELAEQLVGILRAFLAAMNEFERRWLVRRPIPEGGFSCDKWGPGGILWSWQADALQSHRGLEAARKVVTSKGKMTPFEIAKDWEEALIEKGQIWRRFLTDEERPNLWSFHQQDPPHYDPALVSDPDVRLVEPEHAIIALGEPRPPGEFDLPGRRRYHLRMEGDAWRIERLEDVNDPARPFRLDLQ